MIMVAHTFSLPDFFANTPYQSRLHPLTSIVVQKSQEWVLRKVNYDEKERTAFLKTGGGLLCGYCYPNADAFHIQVCADWMDWVFCLDDWSDKCSVADAQSVINSIKEYPRYPHEHLGSTPIIELAKNLYDRFFQTAGPGCAKRFVRSMDIYLDGVVEQAVCREKGSILDTESYTILRRKTSGVWPCFALIEFAARIDLPDAVVEHPLIRSMEEATNDWISWTNDILSYSKEQADKDAHNLIAVIMNQYTLDLQSAVDLAGSHCFDCITKFEDNRKALPSWGEEIDREVDLYVQGLQDWIIGSLHWSFACRRYFGAEGKEIKEHRTVFLLSEKHQS